MSRTAQTHDRENAPRKLQHATRGRRLPPLRRTTRRTSGVQHGTWLAGDPIARGAKGENEQDAANAPRYREYRQPPRAPAAHWGERHYFAELGACPAASQTRQKDIIMTEKVTTRKDADLPLNLAGQ